MCILMPENFDSIIFVGNSALIELRILLLKMCIHVFAGCFNDFFNELCPFLKIILCNVALSSINGGACGMWAFSLFHLLYKQANI